MLWRRAVMLEIPFPDSYGRLHLIASFERLWFWTLPSTPISDSQWVFTCTHNALMRLGWKLLCFPIQAAIRPPMLSSRAHFVMGV
jgi:hypothetical protein